MRLKHVVVQNFRSIGLINITFDPRCRVLVGINESGKSNILRALSMISDKIQPTSEDLREPLPSEKPISESRIKFFFGLESDDIEKTYDNLLQKLLTSNQEDLILENSRGQKITIKEFCELRDEGLYDIDVKKRTKNANYSTLEDGYITLKNWKKPNDSCPADFAVDRKGEQVKVVDYALINTKDFDIPENYLDDIEPKDINDLVGKEISTIVKQKLPEIIWWEYKEENLLQPSISLEEFSVNPDINVPLKNMFALAGIQRGNISNEINTAKTKSPNALRNLLKRVAKHTTTHFRSVWKEYRNIDFALEPNANNIDAGVTEKNFWSVKQRSDGFKRFVTFLLLISAQEKTKSLENTLILIDEPDISLHPTGARYLRDELIRISRSNYVVYSTHSIFMIDRDNLERHIIVKKENEKTNIKTANESNIFDEEVLYNAVGASVFDVLKEKNLIFEGWKDKKLFEVALDGLPKRDEVKNFFKDFGYCHAQGVKDIRRITPILELAKRKCWIISDADEPAKEKQKEHLLIKGHGEWKRYDEISPELNVVTSEDLVRENKFNSPIDKIAQKLNISTRPNFSNNDSRLSSLKKWLNQAKINGETQDKLIKRMKDQAFNDLAYEDIEEKYYRFLKSLKEFIESNLKKGATK